MDYSSLNKCLFILKNIISCQNLNVYFFFLSFTFTIEKIISIIVLFSFKKISSSIILTKNSNYHCRSRGNDSHGTFIFDKKYQINFFRRKIISSGIREKSGMKIMLNNVIIGYFVDKNQYLFV